MSDTREDKQRQRWRWKWFVLLATLAAMILMGVGGYGVYMMMGKAGRFVYSTSTNGTVVGLIDNLRGRSQVVVYQHSIDVMIEKERVTKFLGEVFSTTSSAHVKYFNNKVEWWVDLKRLGAEDVEVDEIGKVIRFWIDEPRVNEEMVVIQTDPQQISVETDRGWVSWPGTPHELAEEAKREIKKAILEKAMAESNRKIARAQAEESVGAIVEALLQATHDAYEVEVEVKEGE
ncbi:hypothetical protein KS4_31360 [Poriferisphaera corsica]|uniref:DUF4230 domain-containing protein n=1 Tax=Poriferisphaera corsica TaxID=2528020 RepID=A0A517YXV2_9BACT|nr:DUF4230 domain-containing protein [Poriferisphaera corsica]QDU35058.1 hypothetical protein KS4_31360 [Poriferisphaera corsica]